MSPRGGSGSDDRRRASVRSFFSEHAASWEARYEDRETTESHDYRARSEVALSWLGRAPHGESRPGRVLELGCGAGVQASLAADAGWDVVGVDLSREMLRRAGDDDRVSVAVAGAERLPFASGTFDAVLALGLIGYVSDASAVLREVRDLLRPGGRLVVSFYSRPPYLLDRLSEIVSWVPDRVYLGLKDLIVGHDPPESSSDPGFYRQYNRPFPAGEFFDLLEAGGYRVEDWRGINFGRVRFMGRRVLPDAAEVLVSRALSRLTALPGLRRLRDGARTHVVTAVPTG